MDSISGTKEQIFDIFVEMTSMLGYENVSMREIAQKVGIKGSSIYNHFDKKETILENAYQYYTKHHYDGRKPIDEMKKMIESAGADEIIRALAFTFDTGDQKKQTRMILITKIIYMRIFQDPTANMIFTEGNTNNKKYVVDILKHGRDIGRISCDFDIETFADILIGAVTIMGIRAFASKDYTVAELSEKELILALLARLFATALK